MPDSNEVRLDAPVFKKATTAIHKLGDISRDEEDYCLVHSETDLDFIGNWCEGRGFIHVRFPKATTRDLTAEETEFLDRQTMHIVGFGGL